MIKILNTKEITNYAAIYGDVRGLHIITLQGLGNSNFNGQIEVDYATKFSSYNYINVALTIGKYYKKLI